MDFELFLRYVLEFLLIIPAIIFAVLPVRENLKFHSHISLAITIIFVLSLIVAGAYFSVKYNLRVRTIFIPFSIVFFVLYIFAVDLSFGKKLFCFFNSVMICLLCPIFAIFLMARNELTNLLWFSLRLFTLYSGFVCVGISIFAGLIFFRTFTRKIPLLLNQEQIKNIWKFLFLLPLVMSLWIYWMTPLSPVVVLTGRVRAISLSLMIFIAASMILFYHIFWWITVKLTESAKLQQENNLLQIESKRYEELKNYMNETRSLRHDFRQHIAVISELSHSGKFFELEDYISQLTDKAAKNYKTFCANSAVDAVAAYYEGVALSQNSEIDWNLNLPSNLPIKESDYCAMLGNLVENALNAVKKIPVENRKIKIMSSMLSDSMLGLSIDNKFEGEKFSSNRKGHGIGLISVSNTVKRYGGTLNINAENNIFSVDIILYFI